MKIDCLRSLILSWFIAAVVSPWLAAFAIWLMTEQSWRFAAFWGAIAAIVGFSSVKTMFECLNEL